MCPAEDTLRQRKGNTVAEDNETSCTFHDDEDEDDPQAKVSKPPKKKPSRKTHQRRASYVHTEPPPVFYIVTSKNADAVMAAVGAGLCLGILTWLSELIQIPMMASFLIGTSVKMFFNRDPPSLSAFWKSSAILIPMGSLLHYVFAHAPFSTTLTKYSTPIVLTCSMLVWKLSPHAELWAPANNLALYVAVQSGPWGASPLTEYPVKYLLTPYVVGHVWVYVFALGWSHLRQKVRAKLVTREFFMNESNHLRSLGSPAQQQERLRALFDRMDLDGNGRLDVHELQLAFRSALGCDISLEESQLIMRSTDTDGDSTLDFHEFCAAMETLLH